MSTPLPRIIQGGMGAGVSGWRLARTVSLAGGLGVVAGTALDLILARRLQVGDPGGHVRRAMEHFPFPEVAQRAYKRFFVRGGIAPGSRFRVKPLPFHDRGVARELGVLGNFVEIFLAKEGHSAPVGVNYLEKIQVSTLPALFGAMLAGVDFVLMGAGLPTAIPDVIERYVQGEPASLPLDVAGTQPSERFQATFDALEVLGAPAPRLQAPRFLGIVAARTVATALLRRTGGRVDGFVVEGPSAGGHNAPPRGRPPLTPSGEPTYGPRDAIDPAEFVALERPFWLAGSYGRPGGLAEALAAGATGIQVGTAFAYCEESDLRADLKRTVIDMARRGEARVFADPVASPTGFPFKVVQIPGTLSEEAPYLARERVCDLGYLRQAYRKENGEVGWRCPAEEIDAYVAKGGLLEETRGRKCVCNALMANIGLGQVTRAGSEELPLVTSGDAVSEVAEYLPPGADSYRAEDVLARLQAD